MCRGALCSAAGHVTGASHELRHTCTPTTQPKKRAAAAAQATPRRLVKRSKRLPQRTRRPLVNDDTMSKTMWSERDGRPTTLRREPLSPPTTEGREWGHPTRTGKQKPKRNRSRLNRLKSTRPTNHRCLLPCLHKAGGLRCRKKGWSMPVPSGD